MKTLTLLALMAAAANLSHGYTTQVFNINTLGPTELPFVDATGVPIPFGTGSVAAGYFGSLEDADLELTDFSLLLADFEQFGGDESELAFSSGTPLDGLFSLQFDAPIPFPGNQFTGNSVYVVIGEGATLGESSGLAVYKTTAQFGTENGVGLGIVNGFIGGGDLLVGDFGDGISLAIFDFDNTIKLASGPIPEPSVGLLAGLAGLGLLTRRRR